MGWAYSIGMQTGPKQSNSVGFWVGALVIALSIGIGSRAAADAPKGYPFLSYDEAARAAGAQNKRLFLYFGRYGCGWCDKTNKEAFSDAAVRERYAANYVLAYVDAESGERLTLPSGERITGAELGARYNVFATPVFMWMEPGGEVIGRVAGIQTAKQLRAYDEFVHSGGYKQKSFRAFLAEIE